MHCSFYVSVALYTYCTYVLNNLSLWITTCSDVYFSDSIEKNNKCDGPIWLTVLPAIFSTLPLQNKCLKNVVIGNDIEFYVT